MSRRSVGDPRYGETLRCVCAGARSRGAGLQLSEGQLRRAQGNDSDRVAGPGGA